MEKITTQSAEIAKVDFSSLPNLSEGKPEQVELSGEYWTPEKEGETKRVFFAGLYNETVIEPESGESRELLTAKFIEQKDGALHTIRNSSRRLVGIFETFAGSITPGAAFEITYLGRKKNSTNSFKSDNWSVKPLTFNK